MVPVNLVPEAGVANSTIPSLHASVANPATESSDTLVETDPPGRSIFKVEGQVKLSSRLHSTSIPCPRNRKIQHYYCDNS